jgi:hypothetical protein
MTNIEYVLSLDQRGEILKAGDAIGRRVKDMIAKPNVPEDISVIWTNLAIIQMNLTNLPRASSN